MDNLTGSVNAVSSPSELLNTKCPLHVKFHALNGGRNTKSTQVQGFVPFKGGNDTISVISTKEIRLTVEFTSLVGRVAFRPNEYLNIHIEQRLEFGMAHIYVKRPTSPVTGMADKVLKLVVEFFTKEDNYLGCLDYKFLAKSHKFPSANKNNLRIARDYVNSYCLSQAESQLVYPILDPSHTPHFYTPPTFALLDNQGSQRGPSNEGYTTTRMTQDSTAAEALSDDEALNKALREEEARCYRFPYTHPIPEGQVSLSNWNCPLQIRCTTTDSKKEWDVQGFTSLGEMNQAKSVVKWSAIGPKFITLTIGFKPCVAEVKCRASAFLKYEVSKHKQHMTVKVKTKGGPLPEGEERLLYFAIDFFAEDGKNSGALHYDLVATTSDIYRDHGRFVAINFSDSELIKSPDSKGAVNSYFPTTEETKVVYPTRLFSTSKARVDNSSFLMPNSLLREEGDERGPRAVFPFRPPSLEEFVLDSFRQLSNPPQLDQEDEWEVVEAQGGVVRTTNDDVCMTTPEENDPMEIDDSSSNGSFQPMLHSVRP